MLDWSKFETLPGSAAINFEKLCRGVVRRNFGSYGPLLELKNQPGVEYYVPLNKDHSRLGDKGDIVGWQCKWFQYRANKCLTASAKTQIEDSLKATKKHLPNLRHWILWTHQTLTKQDQTWFYSLKSQYGFELYLWNEDDLDELLSGPAIYLKQSYFGELTLSPDMLAEQHEKSVAPVLSRWIPEAHQKMELEHQVRKILGESQAWEGFSETGNALVKVTSVLDKAASNTEYDQWLAQIKDFSTSCNMFVDYCSVFDKPICGESIVQIGELVQASKSFSKSTIHPVLRRLRRENLPLALSITNALAYIKDTKTLLSSAYSMLSNQFVAVVADAGGGKTQFSAELTAPSCDRPAGILLLGRALKSGDTLDTLAKTFIFNGQKVNHFEALIAALDSVADRSNCRLPIVIDGLNEAQDPRDWKPLLASILPVLKKYPNVVLVCTLRTGERSRHPRIYGMPENTESRECFARQALPDNSYVIESEGFSGDLTLKAIRAYFKLYKIETDLSIAPRSFFSHPLNLKIFCEVTNHKAEKPVQVSHFPSSVYSLFGQQMQHTASSISCMTNLGRRYQERDIEKAIYGLGKTLWSEGKRSVSEELFRKDSGYQEISWEEDVVNLLAQEGVLFRDSGDTPYEYLLTPVYDRLGGYLIADYLLRSQATQEYKVWMQDGAFIKALFGELSDQHELSQDILHALIALAPKYKPKQQVWQALPENHTAKALSRSYLIDRDDFCDDTLEAYKAFIKEEKLSRRTLEQLWLVRTVVGHPLNADFFSEVLFELTITDRDLSWTEDNRMHHDDRTRALNDLVSALKNGYQGNSEADRLRMVSVAWLLTSTVINLRDLATEALFLYGLKTPENLFEIAKKLLRVNDPYVSERLLAACYGVVASLLAKDDEKLKCILNFAHFVHDAMFIEGAEAATTHLLSRDFASSLLQAVASMAPEHSSEWEKSSYTNPFPNLPRLTWNSDELDEAGSRYDSPFRMDFENYTIGRLVPERGNYDYDHPEYKQVRGNIVCRIKQLGWDAELFRDAEERAESSMEYPSMHRSKIERYGKKYSWIAYYEMAGQLSDDNKLEYWGEERFATDIDPFFPENAEKESLDNKLFLGGTDITTEQWITDSSDPDLDNLLVVDEIKDTPGPWVLLDGYIVEESKRLDRNFHCFIHSYFFSKDAELTLHKYLSERKQVNWPNKPDSGRLYSGEIYWKYEAGQGDNGTIEVTVGEVQKDIDLPRIEINGIVFSEGGLQQRSSPEIEEIDLKFPILQYSWENTGTRTSMARLLLAPWVVEELSLKFNPTLLSYTDQENQPAVQFLERAGDEFSNSHELMYLRKDLLDSLLDSTGFVLVRNIQGERRYANLEKLHANTQTVVIYKTFEYLLSSN